MDHEGQEPEGERRAGQARGAVSPALAILYGLVLLVQMGVLFGAYKVFALSQEHMMVMRYLAAKNTDVGTTWFSPASLLAQTSVFTAIAAAMLALTVVSARRRARLATAQAALASVMAALGIWLTISFSARELWALYVIITALWIALLLQCSVAIGLARRSATAPRTL